MKNYVITLLFLLFMTSIGHSQKKDPYYPWEWGTVIGYKYQGSSFGEIGISRNLFPKSSTIELGYTGYQLGTDFNFNKENFILGPKLSCEYVLLIFSARANLTCYTNFKKTDLRLTPEFGLSYGGAMNIYYGYNIPLNNSEFHEISRHRISITFDLIKYNLQNIL